MGKKREGQEKKEENTAPLSSSAKRDAVIAWRPLALRQVKGLRVFLCAMADQLHNLDESVNTDNVGTGAKILIDDDAHCLFGDPFRASS